MFSKSEKNPTKSWFLSVRRRCLCLLSVLVCSLCLYGQIPDKGLEGLIAQYKYKEGIRLASDKLASAKASDPLKKLYYNTRLSSMYSRLGDVQQAYKLAIQCRAYYLEVTDSILIAEARLADAIANVNMGAFSYALGELELVNKYTDAHPHCSIERMTAHAYSLIFMQTGKLPEALHTIKEAIHKDTSCQIQSYLALDLMNLSLVHLLSGKYEESQKMVDLASKKAIQLGDSIVLGGCMMLRAHFATLTGDTKTWKLWVLKTIDLGKKVDHPILFLGPYSQLMERALQQKQYAEAISYGRELENSLKMSPLPTFQYLMDSLMYEGYKGLNNNEKALAYFESFYQNKSKIFNESYKNQILDLQTNFALKEKTLMLQSSRKDLENAKKRQQFQFIIICLLILLLLTLYVVRWLKRHNARRLYQKEKLMETILQEEKHMLASIHSPQSQFAGNHSLEYAWSDELPGEKDHPSQEDRKNLYQEIIRLMEEEKIYLNPDLTQKHLITQLATNKKYLYQAISRNAEENFKNLINRYRVAESKKQIEYQVQKGKGEPIDQIFRSAGFNSVTSYYRAFKQFTGLTPKEYAREYMHELQKSGSKKEQD